MLTELLRWASGSDLSAREELTLSNAPVLPTVRDAGARCLNLVDPGLLRIATMIAVTGENGPGDLPLLANLSGTTLEQTLAAADQLVQLGFIADDGTLALRHRLMTKALAGGMTAMARSAIHLSTATYLHQRGAAIQRTARHLVASSIRPDDTWPTEVLLEAARGAARAGDHDTALSFTEHTLRTADGEQYLRAVLLACDIRFLTDWERGVDLALASLRELRNEGARLQLLNKLGCALYMTQPDPTTMTRVLATVRATLVGSGLARWDRLYRVVNQWGLTNVASTMDQLGDIVADDAIPMAGKPAAATAIVRAVGAFKAFCTHLTGVDAGEAVRQARHALDEYERTSSTHPLGVPAALTVLVQNGLHEEAAARAQGLEHGDDPLQSEYLVLLMEATIPLGQGRVDAARSGLERLLRALPPAETRPAVPLRITAVGLLAELLAEQGDGEQAWKLLKLHRCAGELGPGWLYMDILLARAGLRAAAGDLDGAARDLRDMLRRTRTAGVHTGSTLAWRRHGVARLWQSGLITEAEDAAAEQVQMAEKAGLPLELGRALRAQARVSDGPRAEGLLREAIDLLQGDDAGAFDLAHAQVDLGARLLHLGEPDRAVAALVEAVGLAHGCGAQPLVQQATALLTAGDRHAAPHTPLRGVLTLTERERQVFLMATRGTSNRRIAETLGITRRTVELHLSSAYRKLGIAGRRDFPEMLSMPGVGPMLEVGTGGTCPADYPSHRQG
ncbi:LuxR C-terminal-related transcriptional regulator [Streptomyces sp. NPDC006668]|uniref:helix-turn-helix transcriptional regulator n=1 Tax=Streptomyces sp. NPDC006668 TaxID=3156903 RepID=UPI0033EBFBAB